MDLAIVKATECRGIVISTTASFPEGPEFKSTSEDRISLPRAFVILFSQSRKFRNYRVQC
jgi:hypothetical protein